MKSVLLVNSLRFPDGDAGAVRVYTFAKALKELGYNVEVITKGCGDGQVNYDGIPFKSFYSNGIKAGVLFLKNIKNYLDSLINGKKIDFIIGYGSDLYLIIFLKYWCKRHSVTFICDVVEWYSKSQFKHPYINSIYLKKQILNKYVLSKNTRIIAISRYLETYYKNKGCLTVRIPILFYSRAATLREFHSGLKLSLVYAGSPGKKDYIYNIIKGLSLLSNEELRRIEFTVFGIQPGVLESNIDEQTFSKVKDILKIKGIQSRKTVIDAYSGCDFSVLLRDPSLRVSKAGFPSKVIECMGYGVPMICNLSSDLADFIVNGVTGIIVADNSACAFADAVRYALTLDIADKENIKKNAYLCVHDKFNIMSYAAGFKKILS